jgi:hypothetical protein
LNLPAGDDVVDGLEIQVEAILVVFGDLGEAASERLDQADFDRATGRSCRT